MIMQQDFKENYIRQQKQQAAERQARLAKIGMGPAVQQKKAPESSAVRTQNINDRVRFVSEAPVEAKRPDATPRRPAPAQQTRTAPVQRPAGQAVSGRPAQPQQSPRPAAAPIQQTRNPNGENGRPQQPARPAASAQSGAARPAAKQTPPASAPAAKGVNGATVAQRPAQNLPPRAQQKRPAPAAASYQSRRTPPSDDAIFKKNLSDEESRAMMFALTGRAEKPDDGGDVDIINMGMIKAPGRKNTDSAKSRVPVGKYIGRGLVAIISLVLFVVIAVLSSVGTIAHGPSETVRDLLVQSAMQASATKWVPYMFLPAETVDGIINKSEEVVQDIVSLDDYGSDSSTDISEDEWANAKDGMIFETVSGSTFKAYVLLIKDPSRVYVGTSTDDFSNSKAGVDVFQAAARYNAVACINAGEFLDNGGHGSGYAPLGLTYSQGKCVYRDSTPKTFIGFDKENNLIVREGMTEKEADALGIRDAVCFQNNNTLIQKDGDNIILFYEDGNAGTSQRTAIGQRADGVVIMIVTDGRSASSLGATHNDMIDLMVSYGAVSAGMLDGGSSAMMWYEDYFNKYDGYDTEKLDEYQKLGLVNNYKAFTEPRKIPTFYMVAPEN